MYYVYRLRSKAKPGFQYTGYTQDLRRRFKEHNAGKVTSTKSNAPYSLIFYAAFEEKITARNFEDYLKLR